MVVGRLGIGAYGRAWSVGDYNALLISACSQSDMQYVGFGTFEVPVSV